MKGVIFNLLEDFIIDGWGVEKFEKIFAQCPLQMRIPYVGPGTYPDGNLLAIIDRTAAELGLGTAEALRTFGRFAFPPLAKKFPVFLRAHDHPKPFFKTLDEIHHVELSKLYPDSDPPRITCIDPGPDRLIVRYASRRRLCPLFAGLLEGAGDYFRVAIAQAQTECTIEGAPSCEFSLHFPK